MKHIFIINPASGKEKNKQTLVHDISDACNRAEAEFEIYVTRKPMDAIDYIQRVCRDNVQNEQICFYACGGDGTFFEVVNGVCSAENNENVKVGLLPVGTGNDFVKSFDRPENFLDIDAQLNATETDVDLIDCNGLFAANMINIGFDCEVVVKTSQIKKSPLVPSKLAYIFGLVLMLVKKPTVSIKSVSFDEGEKKPGGRYLLTTFANGSFCGGGFLSNPMARLDDGNIDSMYINNMSRTKFISLVGSYKSGTHICPQNASIISTAKAKQIEMEFDSPTNVCIDGEIRTFDKITLVIREKALKLRVPLNSKIRSGEKHEAACAL